MTDLFELFQRATSRFDDHVHAVGAGQWHDPTPCTDWDVRTLVNHVAVEQLWVPPMLSGSDLAEVGARLDGDQLGPDPVAAWEAALQDSTASFGAPGALAGTVVASRGEMPTADYGWEMTTDALIHSWDLARAIGADETLDAELVELVYERTLPFAEELAKSGMFAPPVPVADDAPPQAKLLALFGRRT